MFRRHFDDYVHHSHGGPGHHGFGRGPFRGWRARGGNRGGPEGRMFRGGEWSPTPGVVYPTLTMLEEMGYAQASQDPQGRKLYGLTPEGEKVLADNKAQIDAIFARFGGGDSRFADVILVKRAMLNLRSPLQLRLRGRDASPEQIQAIVDALDAAAKTVERA